MPKSCKDPITSSQRLKLGQNQLSANHVTFPNICQRFGFSSYDWKWVLPHGQNFSG